MQQEEIIKAYENAKYEEYLYLLNRLDNFGGEAHFGLDYYEYDATGTERPEVSCCESRDGYARINALSLVDGKIEAIAEDSEGDEIADFDIYKSAAYGELLVVAKSIPDKQMGLLSATQKKAVVAFERAVAQMKAAGVTVIRENESDKLCFIDGRGLEIVSTTWTDPADCKDFTDITNAAMGETMDPVAEYAFYYGDGGKMLAKRKEE